MKLFCKNILLFKLTLAVLMFGYSQKTKSIDDFQALILGGAAITGIGVMLYNLHTNSVSYHQGVIDSAYKSFHASENYLSLFKILQQQIDPQSMNDLQKRIFANQINENILSQLEIAINHFGVDAYLNNLNVVINSLVYNNQNLRTTVSKLSRKDNCLQMLRNANDLYSTINEVISKLNFLQMYLNTHKSYFKLYNCGKLVSKYYEIEIRTIANELNFYFNDEAKLQQIKKQILTRHRSERYPYMVYVQGLEGDINNLKYWISNLSFRYSQLLAGSHDLLSNINWILNSIVVDKDYLQEKDKYNLAKQKEEQQRRENELREREVAAKEREAAAREREAYAKQQEAAARQQQNAIKAAQVISNQNRPANNVHIHVNR